MRKLTKMLFLTQDQPINPSAVSCFVEREEEKYKNDYVLLWPPTPLFQQSLRLTFSPSRALVGNNTTWVSTIGELALLDLGLPDAKISQSSNPW